MTTLFIVCFFTGFGLALISLISGLDHVNVFERFLGHHHVGHARLGHHHQQGVVKGGRGPAHVAPLNMAAITAFLACFGGAGMALLQLTHWIGAVLIGVASAFGIAGGAVVNRFLSTLMRSERTAQPISWAGTIAKVTIPIREKDGTGEIVFLHDGTRQVAGARSDSGRAIDKGAEVIVMKYDKGIAYVCTWEELPAAPLEH